MVKGAFTTGKFFCPGGIFFLRDTPISPITKGQNEFWSPLLRALRAIAQIFESQIWIKITKHHFFSMKNWTFQCRLEPSRSKVQFRILVQSWGV